VHYFAVTGLDPKAVLSDELTAGEYVGGMHRWIICDALSPPPRHKLVSRRWCCSVEPEIDRLSLFWSDASPSTS
jgi:hypothetical protein